MPFKLLWTIALRNILRNPRRSFLTILAIVTGLCGAVTLSSMARGISRGMVDSAIRNLTGHIQIHHIEYRKDPSVEFSMMPPSKEVETLLNASSVKAWSSRVRVPAAIMSERESFAVTLLGINPEEEGKLSFIKDSIVEGKFLNSPDDPGIIVGAKLLETLQSDLGKRVVLMSTGMNKKIADRGFRIVGVFKGEREALEKAFVFTGIRTAQDMLGLGEAISEVGLQLHEEQNLETVKAKLQKEASSLEVASWKDLEPMISALVKVQGGFLLLWFFIVVVVVSFGVVNSLFMAIFERTRELGLVQALGMKPKLILLEITLESIMLIVAGSILGNMLSWFCIYLLSDGIDLSAFAQGAEYVGFKSVIYPIIIIRDWVTANLMILGIGILSSLYPAWKASRYVPAEAITRV